VAEVEAWAAGLAEVHARIAGRFARSEPRERVLAYVRGLLAPLEKKNSWTLAEQAGEPIPDGMQRLLAYATGMAMRSATTYETTSSSIWRLDPLIARLCWWSTRPVS